MYQKFTTRVEFFLLIAFFTITSSLQAQSPVIFQEVIYYQSSSISQVDCNTAPVISCPPTYFGCPGDDISPDVAGLATAVPGDTDCPNPVVTYLDDTISIGPCIGEVYIHRIWSATYPGVDLLFADCTQLILLQDTNGPIISNCPSNIEVAPNSNCEAVVTWVEPTATDDCGLQSIVSDIASGSTFSQGVTIVTYTATDDCGNTSTCTFNVSVEGSCCLLPPVILCPEDFVGCPTSSVDPSTTGMATATMGSDDCEAPTVTYTDVETSGTCAGSKIIERTWLATYPDDTSLQATCVQNITLDDSKSPLITGCPSDITIEPGADCQAIASWTLATAADNCGLESFTSNYESGASFPEGETTVTYTAIDDCGNSSICSFTVTVTTCCNTPPTIVCPEDYIGCPDTDITPAVQSACAVTPTAYTGWSVATCNAENADNGDVGVIFNITNTNDAPQSMDWATSITAIHPANWKINEIGQIFGIALGADDAVYLGASDIYDTQYNGDPYGPGQIFRASANDGFIAKPFVELPNTGGSLNGIGNLVYDNKNYQIFASNLEDGKIYRISLVGNILDTYDPWIADDNSAGIVTPSEQVWGIGLNIEDGIQKIYFPRIDGTTRDMYSISLENGQFPTAGSENLEFSNIMGVGLRISDIAFSDNGTKMVFAERGTKFTTGAHDSKTLGYELVNGSWQMELKYFVGAWVTEDYPSIVVEPGENSAGGVDFGAVFVDNNVNGCDEVVWSSMNYFQTEDGSLFYGIQGINATGNNSSESETNPNSETDIIIDFDGEYETFVQKGDLGDVEIFKSQSSLISVNTGVATATSEGVGCGEPLITYSDEVVSTGPCEGTMVVNRTWTATDGDNPDLSATCTQTITLEDTSAPIVSGCPADITVNTTSTTGIATWIAPTATDNCNLIEIASDYQTGDDFPIGTTTVTYTAIDGCDNVTLCTFDVTIIQLCNAAPIIACPTDYLGCPSNSTQPATTGTATAEPASDECGIPIVTYTDNVLTTGPCTGATKIERTWTATDPSNSELVTSCVQVIELVDTEAPVVSGCPADITVNTTSATGIATWTEPTATDNCNLEWIMGNYQPGDEFPIGTTTVIYSAVDDCENVTLCLFDVTIVQLCNTAPLISCPTDYLGCPSTSTAPSTTGTATTEPSSDECGIPILTYVDNVLTTGPCTGATKIKRLWTATDPGNSELTASCIQIIELIDTEAPIVSACPEDITVSTTSSTGIATWTEPTAIDNCNLEWIMGDYDPGDSFPIGTTLVTYTAVDDCENVTLCTFNVTVIQEGTIECPDDIVVSCSGTQGTVVTWDLPITSTSCPDCTPGDSIPGYIYMGELNGSSYYCSLTKSYADYAVNAAASIGGHLAVITSQEEQALLQSFIGNQCAYIGLSDSVIEGEFAWTNGESLDYTNWAVNQPNNYNGNQDCVVMCSDGWNDEYCTSLHEFIVEIPCGSYVQTSGQPNGSLFYLGTDTITYQVTDNCGNQLECSFTVTVEESLTIECYDDYTYACPTNNTGVNVHWDTPEVTSCCVDCSETAQMINGYMYMGNYSGSNYYCSINPASWPQANANSNALGGHLAEVNSAGENNFLAEILTIQRAWIGLSDASAEGTFKWSTGKSLDYTNWYPGQPNDDAGYQDYVAMQSSGLWNDEYNNLSMEYIMEVPCTQAYQIGGPTSGSYFPAGSTTTITYAGIDACGNTDTCSFDITINTASCNSYGIDSWYMWIEELGFGDYWNQSGNNGGYADFTEEECIEVTQGETYPVSFTPGYANNLYVVYWRMWIDYNQDGDYLDYGEFVAEGSGYNQLTGNLPIPLTCLTGETHMRLSMKYGSYPSGPCAVFTHGEVEDYCLNISGTGAKLAAGFEEDLETITMEATDLSLEVPSTDIEFVGNGEVGNETRSTNIEKEELSVFPNPARDILNIESNILGVNKFFLLDNQGRLLETLTLDFTKGDQKIDVSNYPSGIYFLRSTDNKTFEKVIIQK